MAIVSPLPKIPSSVPVNRTRSATAYELYKDDPRLTSDRRRPTAQQNTVLEEWHLEWADAIGNIPPQHIIRLRFPQGTVAVSIVCLYITEDIYETSCNPNFILREKFDDVYRRSIASPLGGNLRLRAFYRSDLLSTDLKACDHDKVDSALRAGWPVHRLCHLHQPPRPGCRWSDTTGAMHRVHNRSERLHYLRTSRDRYIDNGSIRLMTRSSTPAADHYIDEASRPNGLHDSLHLFIIGNRCQNDQLTQGIVHRAYRLPSGERDWSGCGPNGHQDWAGRRNGFNNVVVGPGL